MEDRISHSAPSILVAPDPLLSVIELPPINRVFPLILDVLSVPIFAVLEIVALDEVMFEKLAVVPVMFDTLLIEMLDPCIDFIFVITQPLDEPAKVETLLIDSSPAIVIFDTPCKTTYPVDSPTLLLDMYKLPTLPIPFQYGYN